jgi:hypothetical protein
MTNHLLKVGNPAAPGVDHSNPASSEELRVVARLECHDGSLAVCLRSGRWIHLLPTGTDSFDADVGGITLQFTRNAAAEVTEVKASGSRVRNLRHTRVALPKT